MNDQERHKSWVRLAEMHVDWWLKSVRPILIDNFVHGIKHGYEEAEAQIQGLLYTNSPLFASFKPTATNIQTGSPGTDDEGDRSPGPEVLDPGFPVENR